MIKYNSNTINDWNFGDDNIVKVYRGVKGKPKHNYEEDYLTLVAETDNVSVSYSTATSGNKLKYSLDSGSTWSELGNNQSTSAINSGEKILFKASGLTVDTERGIGKIIPSALASVEGNIMSLAYGDNFSGQTVIPNNFQFRKLFSGVTSITSAENMALPATTIKKQCYSQMFQACTNLTKTPKVIGSSAMTWDGDYCFSDMFNSCTSLTTVPSGLLPAKNLSSACYWCFFQYCSNLTNTPLLPATTLVSNCYLEMFKGCTKLNHIEALFTTTPSSSYMSNWVSGVTNSGTFYKNSEATWTSSCGTSTYPCNWTVENYVPSDNQEEESSDYVGVVVYYKVITSGSTPEYKVCYAVVDDISQYSETEYEDVYDKATEKWYKLNNLNQYEEYGIYGSGRTECSAVSFTELTDIIAQSTTAITNHMITISPQVGTFSKIRINTTKKASSTSYNWIAFKQTETGSEVMAFDMYDFGAMNGLGSGKNYVTDADGSQTFANWVDANHTIVEIDIAKLTNNQVSELWLLGYQDNTNPAAASFYMQSTDCVTTYNGKLTIDDGYEYEWNGSSWANLGEVSGSSRVPIGYTEVEYIENTTTGTNYYIDTQFKPNQDTRVIVEAQPSVMNNNPRIFGSGPWNGLAFVGNIESVSPPKFYFKYGQTSTWWQTNVTADTNKHTFDLNKNSYYIDNVLANTASTSTFQLTTNIGIFNAPATSLFSDSETFIGKVFSCKIYDNGTLIRDFVPCYRDSDSKSGLYDVVNDVFYTAVNTSYNFTLGAETGSTEYPKYYSEKSDPLDDLTFSSMTEANQYAYNNCVYDGLRATIDGDLYTFDSDEGWVEVTYYYKFEDITPSSASGWTITDSTTYNPDSSYYDDFSVENGTTTNLTKIAKITIFGYDHFTYYLRSYGYSNYAYVTSTNLDEIQTDPTSNISYNSSSAITNTYSWNKNAGSAVNLSNYRRVTYNNLDKTVEHTFYVTFYGRTYSSYQGNATILIPKEQTNENWEQVTFSASSNVASNQKSLYIDNNNSTSGGTNVWYNRWIVGLPSGSHSSYTNYSNYAYCPNVTSSTFTSVAGEQRQVNFTYDSTTDKTLSFRLTDGSNVLTPSDTVYYNMTYYNSCGLSSSSSNVTFPRSQSVKVGGSFSFSNSSNRHYIYGYQPPTLGTRYYVDNYQSTFDITYTKLSEEAVTVTYTTYDPNDVETPAFNTDITYPYNGGTTSSTTLTSFDVPYTYPYTVKQTNAKFSADSQSYTASGASRTITFTLYPNNREFSTVADMEAYQYAWEGMKATVGDTKYKYENGEWVENTHSLPDVPFVLNYNAKQYDATTHTIAMTDGQLNGTDAIAYNNPNNIVDHSSDGYITISNSSMRIRKENQDIALFNRSSNSTSSDLTIVCKAKTTGGENIITNRDSNYNWMYRLKSRGNLTFHGTSETSSIKWNKYNPDIMSVRTYYDNGTKLKYNNWTQNTSTTPISFTYGSTNGDTSKAGALFVGYSWSNTSEQWSGDFYWVYMAQANLTDEQIQQVIDYNENL